MSAQQLTYEGVLEMFRETREQMRENSEKFREEIRENSRKAVLEIQEMHRVMKERDAEFDKIRQEVALQIKETNRRVGDLTSSIGRIVEHMLGGRILDKFQALGYEVDDFTRNHAYRNSKLGIRGEIDLILLNGDIVILIEVKTKLETSDVRHFIGQIEKYRRHVDAAGILYPPSTRFIGAVAGGSVEEEAINFAHENGLYTIVQSGEAVEILPTPENFQAKVW